MRTQPKHKDLSISLYKTCALLYEFIELSPPPLSPPPTTTHRISIKIMLWELFTPNLQRIKSICAIGAMLQQVLL